jgi:tetratricopeptide (TPR) repeat protein
VLREQTVNEQSITKLGRAAELYTKEPRYLVRLSQTYMILANEEAAKPADETDARKVVNYIRESIAVMERAAAIAPNDARVAESLGLIYENSSLYAKDALPKAFDAYEKALSLEPNNPLLLVKLGTIKRAMGDALEAGEEQTALYDEAKGFFEAAIEKKADLPLAHYNLAVVLSRMKAYDAAIDEASKSTALEPGNVTYGYGLGSLYQARGTGDDYDKAKTIFENILNANEKLVDVRLALGILHEQRKEIDAALAEYRKILELLPEGTQADTIREQVNTFIENLQSGRGNISANEPAPAPAPAPAPETGPAQQTLEPNPAANPAVPVEPVPAPAQEEPAQ